MHAGVHQIGDGRDGGVVDPAQRKGGRPSLLLPSPAKADQAGEAEGDEGKR